MSDRNHRTVRKVVASVFKAGTSKKRRATHLDDDYSPSQSATDDASEFGQPTNEVEMDEAHGDDLLFDPTAYTGEKKQWASHEYYRARKEVAYSQDPDSPTPQFYTRVQHDAFYGMLMDKTVFTHKYTDWSYLAQFPTIDFPNKSLTWMTNSRRFTATFAEFAEANEIDYNVTHDKIDVLEQELLKEPEWVKYYVDDPHIRKLDNVGGLLYMPKVINKIPFSSVKQELIAPPEAPAAEDEEEEAHVQAEVPQAPQAPLVPPPPQMDWSQYAPLPLAFFAGMTTYLDQYFQPVMHRLPQSLRESKEEKKGGQAGHSWRSDRQDPRSNHRCSLETTRGADSLVARVVARQSDHRAPRSDRRCKSGVIRGFALREKDESVPTTNRGCGKASDTFWKSHAFRVRMMRFSFINRDQGNRAKQYLLPPPMAPRGHHLTEVALLASASTDLAAAGAGEREGWLDDPAVLASLSPLARALAVASAARSVLVIVPIGGGGGVTVKPALGPDEGRISAVEWVPLGGEDSAEAEEGVAVAMGTDAGWLLFYSLAGDLLHKQSMYPAKILKLNFRERKENAWEDSGSDELSVVFSGIIGRFDGADLQNMLQKSFQDVKSRLWKDKFEEDDADDEASPLTCLKDSPRKGERLTLSPSGTLAAITDSLGRILLLDTHALVAVRLWKIWQMRTGSRLLTIPCPKGSRILQPSTRFSLSPFSSYSPLEVYLFNGDSGQLSVLNRHIG
ncbi:hypothetical protein PR202_gb22861 [Eleusine coracana subsp. coracana]|uniref:Rab3-GAP regulatory subunit N-terminal domain-containing protein n=1 Tax=Eleusine coracana subsp. coracana TaxID=191504 RepID=A0AAV5FIU6_ELECO|nr:hypothetical protein PR202_gb22861 [Eleusine coracana subsp. coracana]